MCSARAVFSPTNSEKSKRGTPQKESKRGKGVHPRKENEIEEGYTP